MQHFLDYLHKCGISDELVELTSRDKPAGARSFIVVPSALNIYRDSIVISISEIAHTDHKYSIAFLNCHAGGTIKFVNSDQVFWPIEEKEWEKHWQSVIAFE